MNTIYSLLSSKPLRMPSTSGWDLLLAAPMGAMSGGFAYIAIALIMHSHSSGDVVNVLLGALDMWLIASIILFPFATVAACVTYPIARKFQQLGLWQCVFVGTLVGLLVYFFMPFLNGTPQIIGGWMCCAIGASSAFGGYLTLFLLARWRFGRVQSRR
jgi:hypothetical protein